MSVTGVTPTNDIQVIPASNISTDAAKAYMSAAIITGTQASNTIALKAFGEKPTTNIPIVIMIGDEVSS